MFYVEHLFVRSNAVDGVHIFKRLLVDPHIHRLRYRSLEMPVIPFNLLGCGHFERFIQKRGFCYPLIG